jgi:HEAT repeat protein
MEIFITLSVGVATAPADADNGKLLIQKADTALYLAKQSGRDRVSDAANAAAEDIFSRIAIQSLDNAKITGRSTQLAQVSDALKKFSQRKNQFLVVEGVEGMGKSVFLQAVQKNLEGSAVPLLKVCGTPQELFRPYYLISNLLVELLNRRKDKGKSVLDALTPEEVNSLSFVLPSLTPPQRAADAHKNQRESIFHTLVHFVYALVDFNPFMIFADDLHFADEASLLLFRAMILQTKIPLFFCGASSDFLQTKIEINPLKGFWQSYGEELNIQKIILTPLSEKDIAAYLEGIFPSLAIPADFEKEIAQITEGSPLFVAEILNKLVHDQRIVLKGQQWMLQPLDSTYLPLSLDEIITEKIASFDEESRRILNHASIFGESVSLSMLTGSLESMETSVLDFLNKATAYGLVISDFRADDENIRFLSKRIQEIVYGNIQQDQKESLHAKIAFYQEKLFEKRLLPSAAILAWHFNRSANLDKARFYDQQNQKYSTSVFVAEEAVHYAEVNDTAMPDVPLDPKALKDLPHFFRSLLIALRGVKLYPVGSKGRTDALCQLKAVLGRILAARNHITVSVDKGSLIVNGETIDTVNFKSIAERICNLFMSIDLNSLVISRDSSETDLDIMLKAIGLADPRKIHPRFWRQVSEESGLIGIQLKQVRFTRVEDDEEVHVDLTVPAPQIRDAMLQTIYGTEHRLTEEQIALIPQVIGSLMGTLSKMKLYPLESLVITDAIDQVMAALEGFLSTCPTLTLTAVDTSLLVNGVKMDTLDYMTLASRFLLFLQSVHLDSITFMKNVSSSEVISLLTTVLKQPAAELDEVFWRRFAKQGTFKGILLNRNLYTVFEETAAGTADHASAESGDDDSLAPDHGEDPAGAIEPVADPQKDSPVKDLAGTLKDLFLRGEEKELFRLLKNTFQDYVFLPVPGRKNLVETFEKAASHGQFTPPPRFLKLLAEHLCPVLRKEEESEIIEHLSRLLQKMAFSFLQHGEYSFAGWVFGSLNERFLEFGNSGNERHRRLMQKHQEPLPPHVLAGLGGDLKSSDPARRQQVMLFLSTMDDRILPFILDIIKQEEDLRMRQLTAALIGNMGPDAIEAFKRDLVLEVTAEERVRMLDIADVVSRDISVELSYALRDEKTQVRRAAFRLAERLNDEQTVDLLCDIAQMEEAGKALPAIRSLGRMQAVQGVPVLAAVLSKAKEPEIQMACCQALGQIADPAGMDILIRILTPKGLLSLQKKYTDNLRAAAAFALARIPHPRVAEVMKSFAEDGDSRVRQAARAVLATGSAEG